MKGLTKKLREMVPGEQIVVPPGTARDSIYLTARQAANQVPGFRVSLTKFVGGFYVTRVNRSRELGHEPAGLTYTDNEEVA